MVTGRFGQDPFRPQFLAETSLISWTFRPQNVNDSANKYERFGQINYIAAETSLQNWCLSSAILLAVAIVTNVSHYLWCHSLYVWCHCLIFVLCFLCFCFRLPFLSFLSDVIKYLLVIMNYLSIQTNDKFVISPTGIFCREMGKQPSGQQIIMDVSAKIMISLPRCPSEIDACVLPLCLLLPS